MCLPRAETNIEVVYNQSLLVLRSIGSDERTECRPDVGSTGTKWR